MKTAVIVLTYNRPLALLAAVRSLMSQCEAGDEVWIADDGSSADNVELARAGLQRITGTLYHVWHPDVGFTAARARNMAAALTQAEYLLFLDGDCVPHGTWLQQHKRLACANHFVNGSRVLLNPALTQRVESTMADLMTWNVWQWIEARGRGECNKLTHLARWPFSWGRDNAVFRWKGIRSCNFGVWRCDYEKVNGFDESFSGWGHEDADLVLRLHNAGLVRRNGFWGTEVFHLWHKENDRARELENRAMVQERIASGTVKASLGLDRAAMASDVRVSRWGKGF